MIKKISDHIVRNGNVMDHGWMAGIMRGKKAQLFYSDPPWGLGNLRYWDTMNVKMNEGADRWNPDDLEAFTQRIVDIAVKYTEGYVVLDMGIKWNDWLIEMCQRSGLIHAFTVETLYRSGSLMLPLLNNVFVTSSDIPIHADYHSEIYHTTGYASVAKIIGMLGEKGKIFIDPCCGVGLMAEAAVRHGMIFRGNELNHKRFMKTVSKLEKLCQ